MVFWIYGDRMIKIIKRSLYGVTCCKKWSKIFIWENVCITRKQKTIKTRIYKRHIRVWLIKEWKYFWLTSSTHMWNVLLWNSLLLFIFLYWCRTCETVLGKPCKKFSVVLLLHFYYSHPRRLLYEAALRELINKANYVWYLNW